MKYLFECRRTFIAFFAICCLTTLGILIEANVAGSIATTALAVAAANASQKAFQSRKIAAGPVDSQDK